MIKDIFLGMTPLRARSHPVAAVSVPAPCAVVMICGTVSTVSGRTKKGKRQSGLVLKIVNRRVIEENRSWVRVRVSVDIVVG
jgi:hypothetical protein